MDYLKTALFIYDEPSEYMPLLKENEFGTLCQEVGLEEFLNAPQTYKSHADHLLIACNDENFHRILQVAVNDDFSLAFLPNSKQKNLIRSYGLSSNYIENIEIALRNDLKSVDLIFCDGEYYHQKVHLGDTPLIHSVNPDDSFLINFIRGVGQFFKLKLFAYDIQTAQSREIKTAASGLLIANHIREKKLLNSLFYGTSMRDGQMSMIIVSPFSILKYFYFLSSLLRFKSENTRLPDAISFVKSEKISITTENIRVTFDGGVKQSMTPLSCEIKKEILRINASDIFWQRNEKRANEKEVMRTANLPDEKERGKYIQKYLPFFEVASTERFKELFQILRDDAKMNSQFTVMMFLSTVLAAIGLFANSAAVVIGAMVLAPLMTPIVAFAMGILRGENEMMKNALAKVILGIVVALSASALMAVLLPQVGLTGELKARINPTLLDLGVAIFSGIAAAYSKSHQSIRESLAGVAIAVALVPPLATAGIGLGQGDLYVFYGGFLLFFTNLVGITLAATITFQFLGFSNAVKSKKSLIVVSLVLVIVSYPLYLSYTQIVREYRINTALAHNRFLIDDKYIIIDKADIVPKDDLDMIRLKIIVRGSLDRRELGILKKKVEKQYKRKISINVQTESIL